MAAVAFFLLFAAYFVLPEGNPVKASISSSFGNIFSQQPTSGNNKNPDIAPEGSKSGGSKGDSGEARQPSESSRGQQQAAASGSSPAASGVQEGEEPDICPEYRGLQMILLSNGFYAVGNESQIIQGWEIEGEVPCYENDDSTYTCTGSIAKQGRTKAIGMIFSENGTLTSNWCS